MRTDQYIGLSLRAKEFVKGMKILPYDKFEGAFQNEFTLYEYFKWNKRKKRYHEIIQAEPWSSGPMFFITLKEKRNLDWTEEEIQEML